MKTRQENGRGGRLTVSEGPRHGPPLMLLPGMIELWTDYEPVLPALTKSFHVIVVEHRGHGTSDWAADGRYRVVDYADDVIVLLERMNLGPVFISGNSLGGLIALNVAARRPELVRAIALEDAPLLMTLPPKWTSHWMYPLFDGAVALLTQWRALDEPMNALVGRIAAIPLFRPRLEQPQSDRATARDRMLEFLGISAAADSPEKARLLEGWRRYVQGDRPTLGDCLPRVVLQSMAEIFATVDVRAPAHAAEVRLNEGFDHSAALRTVQCPVLLLEADRILGGIVSPEEIEAVKSLLQHVPHRHLIVDGAGHHIHCDAPDRFVQHLAEFFLTSGSHVARFTAS